MTDTNGIKLEFKNNNPTADSTPTASAPAATADSTPTADTTKYVLLPEFKTEKPITTFLIVIITYTAILISYIVTAIHYDSYTPFTGGIFEATNDAQRRLKNHINSLIFSEGFTVNPEEMKENTTIFDKLRIYINRFITNIFYVKGNTVAFTT